MIFYGGYTNLKYKHLKKLNSLTVDSEFGDLGLGEMCAFVESLTGEFQPILFPGDLVGNVGHGCHPTIVSLQRQSTNESSVSGQRALVSVLGKRKKNQRKTTYSGLSGEYRWQISCCNN